MNFAQVTGPPSVSAKDVTHKVDIADNDVARLMYVISVALTCLPLLAESHELIRELGEHANYRQFESSDGVKLVIGMARFAVKACRDLGLFVEGDVRGYDTSSAFLCGGGLRTHDLNFVVFVFVFVFVFGFVFGFVWFCFCRSDH